MSPRKKMAPECAQCDGPAQCPIFWFAVKGAFVSVRLRGGHYNRCDVHLVLCHDSTKLHFKQDFHLLIQLKSLCPTPTCTNIILHQKIHLQHQLEPHSGAPAASCTTSHTPTLYSKLAVQYHSEPEKKQQYHTELDSLPLQNF